MPGNAASRMKTATSCILIFLPAALVLTVATVVFAALELRVERSLLKTEERELTQVLRWAVENDLAILTSDVQVLRSMPVLHTYLRQPSQANKVILEDTLRDFAQAKHLYDRIDFYDTGRGEIVHAVLRDDMATIVESGFEGDPDITLLRHAATLDEDQLFYHPY